MMYIITPVFNRKNFTRNFLLALSNQTFNEFKVVIVDDGSSDGTVEMIESEFPEVILLKQSGDLWWAEATNIGINYAIGDGARYIMTLNDDTLPGIDFIEKISKSACKKPKALIGAVGIDAHTDKIKFGGEIINWKNAKFESIFPQNFSGLHKVNNFPGRGLLIPVEVFKNIGFFDSKNFPQTVADIDFTVRAHNAGYEIFCDYDARIKIFPDESGAVKLVSQKSLSNYYHHLFGIKGGGNLKWFTIFAFKNAPIRYRLQFWFIGISRRIGGYLFQWVKELINVN
jgi:GT2 family glycosyltransferase